MVETGRESMSEIPALEWPEIRRVMYLYTGTVCDEEDDDLFVDSLMVLFVENRDAINADVGEHGEMMIRYDTDSGEVIGLEIELFEHRFLKKHPELTDGWTALKPEGDDGFHNSRWLSGDDALMFAVYLKEMAYQGTQVPGWPNMGRRDKLLWSKSDLPA